MTIPVVYHTSVGNGSYDLGKVVSRVTVNSGHASTTITDLR